MEVIFPIGIMRLVVFQFKLIVNPLYEITGACIAHTYLKVTKQCRDRKRNELIIPVIDTFW